MENFEDENPKNIYVIRRKLAIMKKFPGTDHYQLDIGHFRLKIWTYHMQDQYATRDVKGCIIDFERVDVSLSEIFNSPPKEVFINLNSDIRFKDYQPILYHLVQGLPLGNGTSMPILHLCELIRYLYRLSNLTVFT